MPEDNNGDQQQIIIVKKGGGHAGHHGGAWKVAYADFVTAMMAFFLVMWLVNQSQVIKDNVAGYFNDPSGFKKSGGQSILKGGGSMLKAPVAPKAKSVSSKDGEKMQKQLEEAGERIKEALSKMPSFEKLKNNIEIRMTPEGLRIQLIEASRTDDDSSYFFDLGSSHLSNYGSNVLLEIAKELGHLDNRIVIEGHTDSHHFVYEKKYSNWELSADRANSARKLMETEGLWDGQVAEIRGYAANVPRISENPLDARNRRIAIIVLKEFKPDNLSQVDSASTVSQAEKPEEAGNPSIQ